MKTILLIVALLGFITIGTGQQTKFKTIKIKTSAICGECEERIETKLNYSKGVKYADLDLKTNIITVKYNTKILNAEDVKKIVSLLGYHANDVERDIEGFKSLPACCRDSSATCTKK